MTSQKSFRGILIGESIARIHANCKRIMHNHSKKKGKTPGNFPQKWIFRGSIRIYILKNTEGEENWLFSGRLVRWQHSTRRKRRQMYKGFAVCAYKWINILWFLMSLWRLSKRHCPLDWYNDYFILIRQEQVPTDFINADQEGCSASGIPFPCKNRGKLNMRVWRNW